MRFTLPGGAIFSPPKVKALPPPVDRAAVAEEAAKQRSDELRRRRGRPSTVLTGPDGPVEDPAALKRPTLLGQ